MYREISAEEKLQFSSEIIEALKKGGFVASLEVVEKYKKILLENNISTEAPQVETPVVLEEQGKGIKYKGELMAASIYAEKHIPAVQEDLMEQCQNVNTKEEMGHQKSRILRNETVAPNISTPNEISTRPNPWGTAKTVVPGEVKDILTR